MAVLLTLIVGFLVAAIARAFVPGRDPGSVILGLALGMSGAILIAVVGDVAGWFVLGSAPSLLAAVAGAMLAILLAETLRRDPRGAQR